MNRPFVSRMKWKEILPSSLVMPMQRFTNVTMQPVLVPVVIDPLDPLKKTIHLVNVLVVVVLWSLFVTFLLLVNI